MRTLVLLAVGALLCSSIAFATPRALSTTELDQITAGTGLGEAIVDAFINGTLVDNSSILQDPESASGDGGIVVAADNNTTAGAVADNESTAVNGDDNTAVHVELEDGIAADGSVAGENNQAYIQDDGELQVMTGDICVSVTDSFKVYDTDNENEIYGVGNFAFNGTNNAPVTLTTDNSEVDGEIEEGGAGVIAKEATVTDSFNVKDVDNEVDVDIEDSFNTTTNTLDISGQGTVSGIINANSLGFQNIAANLNVTTASSTVPTTQSGGTGLSALAGLGAVSVTILSQINVNGSIAVAIGNEVPIPVLLPPVDGAGS